MLGRTRDLYQRVYFILISFLLTTIAYQFTLLFNRWGINYSISEYKNLGTEFDVLSDSQSDSLTFEEKKFGDASAEKRKLQRNEWFGVLLKIRNNAIIVLAIICLQLPFELAYAHLYEITETEVLR